MSKENESEKKTNETEEVTVTSNESTLNNETLDLAEEEEEKSKSKKIIGLVLIGVGALIILVVVYFFIFPNQWRSLTGQTTFVEEKYTTSDDIDVVDDDVPATTDNVDVLEQVAVIEEESTEPVTNADKELTTPAKPVINAEKWGLTLPCYVISHSAYSTEETAKQIKSKMTQKGFKSGYFYIPDLQPGGKPLFKVFVGPFNSREDAEKILNSVKKENTVAYVAKLEN